MKKYYIITIGCQMNKSDSERIAGKLEELGYKRSDNKYQADLVVINTCGVRQTAEDRIYGFIPEIKKKNFNVKIIVTGCLVYRKDV
ncbi:tRNA (N6-isopentenyl adenosine(37)-C2)-methylthiotransferase MiaB, partial [Patescibacteria group bacterium]|nr:tRNA (N6-isopentenyl adenosine(37)-C2)-methylthiotransferase MiaB [Patescibacteria group bacterium]